MVSKPVDVFVARGPAATHAIHRGTRILIVALWLPPIAGDHDLFASLAKPGGSVTRFSYYGKALLAKQVEPLRGMLPNSTALGIPHNVADSVFREWGARTEATARAQSFKPVQLGLRSSSPAEVSEFIKSLSSQSGDVVIGITDFLTVNLEDKIIRTAAELGIAVMAEWPTLVQSSALILYGADILELLRQTAGYIDRILKDERAGDLPDQFATKYRRIVNLKEAKTLNIAVLASVLVITDEVIE